MEKRCIEEYEDERRKQSLGIEAVRKRRESCEEVGEEQSGG